MNNTDQYYMMQRSMIEHRLLPDQFFDDPQKLLETLAAKGQEILFAIYSGAMPGRFRKEDFSVEAAPNAQCGISVILKLPEADAVLACSLIGLCCGKDGASPEYYTVERTVEGGFLLCTMPDKGTHAVLDKKCGRTPEEHLLAIRARVNPGS